MILFAIALTHELKVIKEEIKALKLPFKVDFLLTGVGVENTIYNLKDYIDKNGKPEFIINIGVCGSVNYDFLDFFQVYKINYLSNNKEIICPVYIKNLHLKPISCSSKIITEKKELGEENFVDMESYGIDFISEKEKIPYIIIKKPFDIVSKDSKKVDVNKLKDSLKGFDYRKLLQEIDDFLQKNKSKTDFDKTILDLRQKYKLTFSETEMLKKYLNKCIAFGENISFDNKDELLLKIKS